MPNLRHARPSKWCFLWLLNAQMKHCKGKYINYGESRKILISWTVPGQTSAWRRVKVNSEVVTGSCFQMVHFCPEWILMRQAWPSIPRQDRQLWDVGLQELLHPQHAARGWLPEPVSGAGGHDRRRAAHPLLRRVVPRRGRPPVDDEDAALGHAGWRMRRTLTWPVISLAGYITLGTQNIDIHEVKEKIMLTWNCDLRFRLLV